MKEEGGKVRDWRQPNILNRLKVLERRVTEIKHI